MSPQRRVTWLSSNPWGKRVAVFVTGAACAAMLLLGLWLESKWLVAGAVATGGGAFALLLLLVFRRVGYLIVLHRATGQGLSLLAEEQMRLKDGLDRLSGRQGRLEDSVNHLSRAQQRLAEDLVRWGLPGYRELLLGAYREHAQLAEEQMRLKDGLDRLSGMQGRLEDSVNHLSRAQQRLAEDLVRWGLPGYRELLLGAYREHAQSQESIGEAVSKAKDQLAQVQQRIDRLQADMGVLSRSLDETLPALNMRLAGQEEGLSRTLAKLDRSLQEALDQNEQKAVSRHAQLEKWLLEQLAELLRQGGQMADLLGSVEDRLASQEEGTGQTVQAIERFRQSLDQVADMLAEISRQSGSVDQHVKRALSELKTAREQESIGEAVSKAKDQLVQVQQRIDRLQADMGVLSRSLDETLPALNMRLAGQEEGLSRTLAKLDRSLQEALDQNEQKAVSRHAQLEKWLLEQLAELLRQGGQMADLLGSVEDRLASQEEGTGQTVQAIERFRQSLDQVADMLAEISRQSGSVDQHVKRALSELKTAREVVSARSEAMQGLLEKIDRNIEARLAAKIDKVTHAIDNGDLRFPLLNDINAMNRLQQRFSPPASLPMMSGWALDAVSLERLIEAVLEHRPRTIVECGSGVSTVWLAYAAREFGGKVVALEHKEKFAEQTRDDLRRHGLLDVADVRLAPLEDIEFDGQVFPWYCKEAWRDLSGIDMLLVDGPPKATGPRARYPALPVLGSSLSNGCVVVFDDINREDEKEILDSWLEAYPKLGKPVAIGDRTVLMEWGAVSSDEHGRS